MSSHVDVVPTAAEIVQAAFPGQGFVPIKEAARFIGQAYVTARHHLVAGTFPLPTVLLGTRKRLVPITALIQYYERQVELAGAVAGCAPAETTTAPSKSKRGPGRPPKLGKKGGAQ